MLGITTDIWFGLTRCSFLRIGDDLSLTTSYFGIEERNGCVLKLILT